jgi:hypothetical protein
MREGLGYNLNIKGQILKVDGEYLYSAEHDEDELPLIKKYRIVDSSLRN